MLKNTGYRGTLLSHYAESYGADKLWCLLKPIPIELDKSEAERQPPAKQARTDGDFGEAN